jgi:anaerobic magnesium-protoporphyrin IX monomethyl ester cyclase
MNVACIYSVDDYASIEKPLSSALQIPFGISMIATVLKKAEHNVELFVLCPISSVKELFEEYIEREKPTMFCLSAVSSQFEVVNAAARVIKAIDPSIFIILGGHHASLDSENAIQSPYLDAICVGEGDVAILELAKQLEEKKELISDISGLWIKDRNTGEINKTPTLPFEQDLDSLPFIDRTLWEPWIINTHDEASILVGRGCPYKCTYSVQIMRCGSFLTESMSVTGLQKI